jgi:hypothetical protein
MIVLGSIMITMVSGAGGRMMKGLLRQDGFTTGRPHVAACMK